MTPRFKLGHQGVAIILTTFIADGRWHDLGLDEKAAEQFLLESITAILCKDDPEHYENDLSRNAKHPHGAKEG